MGRLTFWFESGFFFFTFFFLKKKSGLVKDTSLTNFGLHNFLFITVFAQDLLKRPVT